MKIEVNLNTDEKLRLVEKIRWNDLSVDDLVNQFLQDLIYGEKSSGSDECCLANEYYDRTFFMTNELGSTVLSRHGMEAIIDIAFSLDFIVDFVDDMNDISKDKYSLEELKSMFKKPISENYEELKKVAYNSIYKECLSYKKSIDEYRDEISLDDVMKEVKALKENYYDCISGGDYGIDSWRNAFANLEKIIKEMEGK